MFETSDEYDFTPSASSNLASLFGTSMTIQNDANTSLVYSPPKQPKPAADSAKDSSTKLKQQSVVLAAKVITLYKLEKGEYGTLGKHGLALIKSPNQNNQEMIIYKEKTNIITRAKIANNFRFIHQNDTFSSFFDLWNQNWLVKFETFEDKSLIAKEIKALGGIIVDNNETNKQDGRSSNTLPDNKDVKRIVSPNPDRRIDELDSNAILQETVEKVEESEIETDNSESRVKAEILNRMAKMGQLLLPSNPPKIDTTDMSDSDTTDVGVSLPSRKIRKSLPHKAREKENVTSSNAPNPTKELDHPYKQVTSYNNEAALVSHTQTDETYSAMSSRGGRLPHQLPAYKNNALVVSPSCPPVYRDNVETYETKRHDTEIKLDLLEISTKLDYLIKNSCLPNNTVNVTTPNTNEEKSLRSKLKVVELRVENLTSELQTTQARYSQLQESYKLVEQKLKTKEEKKSDMDQIILKEYSEKIDKLEQELNQTKDQLELLEKYKSENKECKEKIDHLSEMLDLEKSKNKLSEEENKNGTLESDFGAKQHAFYETLKQRMNIMYEDIIMNFSEDSNYTKSQIDTIIAQSIKRTTFHIMKHFENSMK